MDLIHGAILAGAGVIAGIIASIVGGAAVVVYPALLAAGVPPQIAAICNLIALMPATMLAALADRSQLPPLNRDFVTLVAVSVVGAFCGAFFLLLTPARVFTAVVPLLLGFATLLFAFSGRLSAWLRQRAQRHGRTIALNVTSLKMLLPISIYGGYFGAGLGILMLSVFSVANGGDYRAANATKNFVSSLNGFASSCVFIALGAVVWPQTLALMAGTLIGGYLGAHIVRLVPREIMRMVIIATGTVMTLSLAREYWF